MTKAEQYIQDCTRHCSNEIIVSTPDGNSYIKSCEAWITPDQARRAVEIAIADVCQWLEDHIDKKLTIYHAQTWCKREEFINKLKQAMEE